MLKYYDTVLDTEGRPIAGATITVSKYPSGTVTIYSDEAGATIVDGVTSDANGYYEFYADVGRYSVLITASGIGTTTLEPVDLGGSPTGWVSITSFGTDIAAGDTANFGVPAAIVDHAGVVHLRGKLVVQTGDSTAGTAICTLPEAAWPAVLIYLQAPYLNSSVAMSSSYMTIDTAGVVRTGADDGQWFYLTGVSFPGAALGG